MLEIHGDLLKSNARYIVHQCNTLGMAGGLAGHVNRAFPHADIRTDPAGEPLKTDIYHPKFPGNIIVKGNGADERFVICLMGQFNPGGPWIDGQFDSRSDRFRWFQEAMIKIHNLVRKDANEIKIPIRIDFPFQIGCGIAGGDWEQYHKAILDFATSLEPLGVITSIINPNPPTTK